MARTNLKLGALGRAVGVNGSSTETTRLGADGRGSTGTQTSMRADFAVDTVVGPVISDTTPNENASYIITMTYSGGTGNLFLSRIANQPSNFIWAEFTQASLYVLQTSSDYTAGIYCSFVSANTLCFISCKHRDYYNVDASGYNVLKLEGFTIQNSGGRSDIRWKQNIERVGTSQLGLPIFEFEYIDPVHGEGKFRGTIAQELIKNDYAHATYLDSDGYFWVDYSKIDIPFESC